MALALNTWANRLADIRRSGEALRRIQEAVALLQGLADVQPQRFFPDLAAVLNNEPAVMADLSRFDEALEIVGRAVAIRRELAQVGPDVHLRDLALALNNQSRWLAAVGRLIEALAANAEALARLMPLLCRNATRLDICQSLHWPSFVDGEWNPDFGVKTKVLIVDALVRMAYEGDPSLNVLQSLAVRLYGISARDTDVHVKGCLGSC